MTDINSRKILVIVIFFLLGIFSLTLFAQDKKDETDSKLDQLKGKVEKLTVKVDGKDVVFEGKEAEKLVKKLRAFGKTPEMIWLSDEDEEFEHEGGKVMMFKYDSKDKDFTVSDKDDMDRKVEVRIVDGDKKVTVTTMKDGKEETKTYEGEEAEKYLNDNKKSGSFRIMIDKDKKAGDHIIYFDRKNDDDSCKGRMIRVGRRAPDKVKKIIIEKIDKSEKEEKKSNK